MSIIRFKGNGEERIVIDYSKLQEQVKKCKEDKLNKECRVKLKEIGIDFYNGD